MRRLLSLVLPLLALAMLAGCRLCVVEKSADGKISLIAGSLLTDPEIGTLRWATTTATTQTTVDLQGYKSTSKVSGADIAAIATTIAKAAAIP